MKRTIVKIIGITISIILLSQSLNVFAVTKKEVQQKKDDAQKQTSENNDKIDEAKEKKQELANEKSETMKTVEGLISKISDS